MRMKRMMDYNNRLRETGKWAVQYNMCVRDSGTDSFISHVY